MQMHYYAQTSMCLGDGRKSINGPGGPQFAMHAGSGTSMHAAQAAAGQLYRCGVTASQLQ
eukprot:GDKH01021848.1.p1 GENE.GDKH01021848.1~~GDKH01021848.1.p1  ORF type:complete len:60 (-),score=3.61 GDKH01021848.1:91-270(-)